MKSDGFALRVAGVAARTMLFRYAPCHPAGEHPANAPCRRGLFSPLSARKATPAAEKTTPGFYSPLLQGVTHYTLQARSCAKGEHKPPLETPDFVGVWPQIAFLHLCPHPIQNPKKRRRSAHEWWAGLRRFFIRPAGRDGRKRIEKILFPS